MFSIEGNNIYITKGDSAYLTVCLTEVNGSPHKMAIGDKVILTVKSRTNGTPIAQITYTETTDDENTECTLHIVPNDTSDIDVGQYSCDIEYRTGSDVYTIFPVFSAKGDTRIMRGDFLNWKNFWVLPQVTNVVTVS